ncbi:MAG: glycosyltransferase family 39 protein [Bacteroidota bacterium]
MTVTDHKANEIPANENAIWAKALRISLIIVFVLMSIMSFWYGISGDEIDMHAYGKAILQYFTSFGKDTLVFHMPKEFNRDGVIQYYGGLFDLICAVVNKVSPLNEFTTRHLLNAWTGFLAIFFAAKVAMKILNKQAGVSCVWIMFLSPFFLGHAMNNPKDIPFAAAYIAAIYFMIRLFEQLPSPSWKDYLWVILCIGMTINVRVGGILLIPYLLVFAVLGLVLPTPLQEQKVPWKSYVKPLIIVGLCGFFAGSILWPYGIQNPVNNPFIALNKMSDFRMNIVQVYDGVRLLSGELPITFLPKSFLITNTYVVLIGIVLMVCFLWNIRKSNYAIVLYFVLFTAIFPVVYIIYMRSNVYHAWRHELFIFPSIAVVSSVGWVMLSEILQKRGFKYVGIAIVGVLLIEPISFIVSTFPNTITYHNAFVGGIKGAYGNYEMDYYYNSVKQCTDWFTANELKKYKATDTIILATNAPHIVAEYLKDQKNVKVVYVRFSERNQSAWDYVIFHIALIPEDYRLGAWLPSTTKYKAEVRGKTLCAVIKRPSYDDIKGYAALNKKDNDSAITYFARYLIQDPKNISILLKIGHLLFAQSKVDSAFMYLKTAYEIDTTDIEAKRMLGMICVMKNDFSNALSFFNSIVKEDPSYAEGYFYLGMAYEGLGDHETAIYNFKIAVKEPSIAPRCYRVMSDIYKKNNDMANAEEMLDAALQATQNAR